MPQPPPLQTARPAPPSPISPASVAPPAATPAASRPGPPAPSADERIGVVTHYYGHVSVAIVKLETGTLRIGDMIRVRGHTTDFTQRVQSLEVEHAQVQEVRPNDDFGIKVIAAVREHDVVYKVK
jgi:hypothetical protein